MTLNQLIQRVSRKPLSASELETAAADLRLSINAVFDAIAKEVGEGYLLGKYCWEVGDAVMNNVFATAYPVTQCGLPDFAWRVFAAFDEGEYFHAGEPAEHDGEPRTKTMLAAILERPAS